MSRIKYMAYIKSLKWTVPVTAIDFSCQTVEVDLTYGNGDTSDYNFEEIELLQFTGIKDSKRNEEYPDGQEIYDGQILRYYSDARMYVPISEGRWGFKGNSHLEERTVVAWSDEIGAYMVHGSMLLHEINEKAEVIGNMFEHPELMEGW